MRVQFIHKSKLDVSKWDACLSASIRQDAYGKVWFLNLIAGDWYGLVLDDYKAVMPVVTKKKMGIFYIFQPPFYQRSSIYSTIHLDKDTINLFYKAIPQKIKLQEFNVDEDSIPGDDLKYDVQVRQNLVLSLEASYDILKRSYSTNTKRNVKKAEKHSLKIGRTINPSKMIEAYRENKARIVQDLNDEDFLRLDQLIRHCVLDASGEALEASAPDGTYAGGIFVLKGSSRHVLLFMGANAHSKETGAMFALIDFYLKQYAGKNILFDFEGSMDEGVARFYSGFGASEEKYFALRKSSLNKLISFVKRLNDKF